MSSPEISYWGGSTVKDGKVHPLPATNWKEFVERVLQVPVPFHMTRKEFWDLPNDKERDKVKDGPFVCSCAFTGNGEIQRNDSNATLLNAVTLDLDSGDFLDEMAKHPETISEALFPHNLVVWHTAKSRPGIAPRLKIMVEVSPCSPANLKRFLAHVVFLLGIPKDFKGVKESGVVSQAQYRGIQFRGETQSHVLASRVNGIPMHLSDLPELEPDEEEMLNGRTFADSSESDDFYGLAYLPIAGLKVDDIREALNTVDSDVERPTWLSIAAALKHQFGNDEAEAQEAYEAFVDWSSRGVKFAGRKDTYCVWKSLRSHIKGRPPCTIRTLFKFAIDAGWESRKVEQKIAKTIQEWFAECNDREELVLNGAKKIAALPLKNNLIEASLLKLWNRRIVALGGDRMESSTLKSELARVRKDEKKAKAEARKDETPSWLAPYVYVASVDAYYNLGTGSMMKPTAFDRFYSKEMLKMQGDEIPANGIPTMLPGNFAMNILEILRVEGISYDPSKTRDLKIFTCEETGRLLLNSYNFDSPPIPEPEHAGRAELLIRELVGYLIAEPHLQELFLDFLSRLHIAPGVKIPWAFMIQSAPGAGKGTLSEVLEATLGPQNLKIVSPAQMSSNFNEWAVNMVLGVFNEMFIPGERRDAVLNGLKPLISDPTIALNLKHRDGEGRMKNVSNFISFTNYRDAAHLAAEDRRWCICFSPIQTKSQSEALQASGRFEEIRWLKTPEGASALRYFFLKRKISPDFPLKGHAPETKYREEVVQSSKNQLQVFIEDTIEDAENPLVSDLAIHDGALKQLIRNPRDHAFIPRYLSLMGFERHSSKRHMLEATRGYIWIRTEKWPGGDPVRFLKKRLKDAPELDAEDDSDCEFE